jgi:hypothetical protein
LLANSTTLIPEFDLQSRACTASVAKDLIGRASGVVARDQKSTMMVTRKHVVLRMMHLDIQLRGSNAAVIGEAQPCGQHECRTQGHRLSFPGRPCQGRGKSKVGHDRICNDLATFERGPSSVSEGRLLLRKFPVDSWQSSTNSPVL